MEANTPAPTPLMLVGLWLDSRVTNNGLLGLSVNCTLHGNPPRKKTIGPFMSRDEKKQVEKLLEDKKVFEDFNHVVEIWDIQKLKNPFPDIKTPGITWVEILACKSWTGLYRVLQLACVLAQHKRLSIDYLFKVIDHFQANHDPVTRSQNIKFIYILNEPGLPFHPYQVVSDALQLPLLAPPVAPRESNKEEETEQLLPVLKTSAGALGEDVQRFLDTLPPEKQAEFIALVKRMEQHLTASNGAVVPSSKKSSFSSVDQYIEEDMRGAFKTLVKSNIINVTKPSADRNNHNGFVVDTDNWEPEYNFLDFMMESIPHHKIKAKKAVKKYTVIQKFLIKYFEGIGALEYPEGRPYLSFAYLAKPPIEGKPATKDSPEIKPEPGVLETMRLWMKDNGYSLRTINSYIGIIKAVMKRAKDAGRISDNYIPVGRDKEVKLVQPPPLKRTVDEQTLEYIFLYKASRETITYKGWCEALAKLIWIIGFVCFGMPPNELFRLTKEQIAGDKFTYFRNKRIHSEKRVPITVPIDDYIRGLFNLLQKMLGVVKDSPFAFRGLELTKKDIAFLDKVEARNGMTKEEVYEFELEAIRYKKIGNINWNVNQYFKKIIAGIKRDFNVDVKLKITTYMLRHTFVAWAKKRYDLLTIAREMLGHEGGTKTLEQNYGFEEAIATKNDARAQMQKNFSMHSLLPDEKEDKEGASSTPMAPTLPEELPKAS